MDHLINSLHFEVNCPDEEFAFSIRHNFAQTFQLKIEGAVDSACSKYVSDDEFIQIDKLEIDMGSLNSYSIDSEFTNIFLEKFEKALSEKLSGRTSSSRAESKQHSHLMLLQYFLQNGTLPWWANENDIDLYVISNDLLNKQHQDVKEFLFKNRFNKVIWRRASIQLNQKVKYQIIRLFDELKNASALFTELVKLIIDEINKSEKNKSFELISKLKILINERDSFVMVIAPQIFLAGNSVPQIKNIFITKLKEKFKEISEEYEILKSVLSTEILVKPEATTLEEYEISKPVLSEVSGETELTNETPLIFKSEETTLEEDFNKLIVRHAGIVLLSAFFKTFFYSLRIF